MSVAQVIEGVDVGVSGRVAVGRGSDGRWSAAAPRLSRPLSACRASMPCAGPPSVRGWRVLLAPLGLPLSCHLVRGVSTRHQDRNPREYMPSSVQRWTATWRVRHVRPEIILFSLFSPLVGEPQCSHHCAAPPPPISARYTTALELSTAYPDSGQLSLHSPHRPPVGA